jgi:hypothetical protein
VRVRSPLSPKLESVKAAVSMAGSESESVESARLSGPGVSVIVRGSESGGGDRRESTAAG